MLRIDHYVLLLISPILVRCYQRVLDIHANGPTPVNDIIGSYPAIGSNCSVLGPSQFSGEVIHGTVYLYHIFIGNPGDYSISSSKVSTLASFASSLGNSMYAKIMLGYNDQQKNVSSINYIYKGSYFQTSSTSTLNDAYVYNVVNNARTVTPGWQTSVKQSLYLVVFNGGYSYSSVIAGSSWSSPNGWCGFHSNDLRTGLSFSSNYDLIIMPVGGE